MAYENFTGEADYLHARADEDAWRRARGLGVSRRRFFQMLAGAGAAVTLAGRVAPKVWAQPAPGPVIKPTPKELFNDYGSNKEMRWENMYDRGYLVPNELFFVRNHTRTPVLDAKTWRLKVEGSGVQKPVELTYDDILSLPSVSVTRYIECAGNGRSFFDAAYGKKADGTQWKLGAIGVAEWTGVPLAEVLNRAGIKKSARDVMPEGLDDLKVRRPLPAAKALQDDTLLVYAMNGQTLPPDHGFPLRALVPGWIGVANVKWLGRIEVSEEALFSNWNTETYVLIGPDYKAVPPGKGPALSNQDLKSAVELPWGGEIAAARRLVRGRSWSPFGKITKVEYRLDQEKQWRVARLREPNIAAAWVRWDFEWEPAPGKHTISVRATDEKGNMQPQSIPFNQQGYLYNAVVDHPIEVKS
ncbi:MAG TPA: molybdopterin-dependent oxidoreductase [Candidatus Binatia bacterium]|jgi:DMSO/TMAO reductase YedYZ molybdopterin-dependent catalytic subunit|nr:molybdopterin-dependent oxidoreductase [Candidatus Binatia bacterium]